MASHKGLVILPCSHLRWLWEYIWCEFLSCTDASLDPYSTPENSNLGVHLPHSNFQKIIISKGKGRIRLPILIFPFLNLPFLQINNINLLIKSKLLRSDVELVNEADFLDEFLAGVGGEVKLHLAHESVGLELSGVGHGGVH
nr:hypothetical protein Iba_scaffold97272CG0010 [Ipomoea batatas]GMD56358.1 hypothetical protein Iba_scaffold47946CG0010 [Ipomoea batatas]GME00197.1 hypothetical protein Iba_chr15fCG3070 [Ipomoea batatas]